MNRELKFRVWNGTEMIHDVTVGKFGTFYVNPGDKGNGLDPNDSASLTPFTTKYAEGTPVMQFTGLKDKTGKEIWEGDVVKHESGVNMEVSWGHHLWAFLPLKREPNKNYQGPAFPNQFDVIGNIYQNHELLQSGSEV